METTQAESDGRPLPTPSRVSLTRVVYQTGAYDVFYGAQSIENQ